MKLIVGLGNPGKEYRNTRHNVGFAAVEELCRSIDVCDISTSLCSKLKAKLAEGRMADEKVIIAKPQTFMNLSGESVQAILQYYKLTAADLMVIYDDFTIAPGMVRIRPEGGAGGHNGMKSIIKHLNTEQFIRIRIGIAPGNAWQGGDSDYVLGKFTADEKTTIDAVLQTTHAMMEVILSDGVQEAMNQFN